MARWVDVQWLWVALWVDARGLWEDVCGCGLLCALQGGEAADRAVCKGGRRGRQRKWEDLGGGAVRRRVAAEKPDAEGGKESGRTKAAVL